MLGLEEQKRERLQQNNNLNETFFRLYLYIYYYTVNDMENDFCQSPRAMLDFYNSNFWKQCIDNMPEGYV
jgi:hypothetical protein